jgi:hypothetical protein
MINSKHKALKKAGESIKLPNGKIKIVPRKLSAREQEERKKMLASMSSHKSKPMSEKEKSNYQNRTGRAYSE